MLETKAGSLQDNKQGFIGKWQMRDKGIKEETRRDKVRARKDAVVVHIMLKNVRRKIRKKTRNSRVDYSGR